MLAASQEMNFEDAAQYRDLIQSVKRIGERQKITDQHGEDKDVVAVARMERTQWRRYSLSAAASS